MNDLCCPGYACIYFPLSMHTMPCRVREFRRFSEKSDVYSFGVFLLELLSGKQATESPFPDSNQNLVEWVCDYFLEFSFYISSWCNCQLIRNHVRNDF